MIKSIKLKNFLLISEQELNFDLGINAIFGETGSGKSIIFKALMQLSGQKGERSLIRAGEQAYLIEACFTMNKELERLLKENEIEVEDELHISRKQSDKAIIRINGEKVTLKVLQQFSNLLFDFTNQHEVAQFNNPKYLLELVSEDVDKSLYLEHYQQYLMLKKQISSLSELEMTKDEKLEILKYRLKQLDKISQFATIEDYDDYLKEFNQLKEAHDNSENYKLLTSTSSKIVKELNNLSDVISNLETNELLNQIDEQIINFEELDFQINKMYTTDFDQYTYDEMALTINNFKSLMRTYKMNEQQLLNYKEEINEEIATLDSVELDLKIVKKKYNNIVEQLQVEALKISSVRQNNAKNLKTRISNLLSQLSMEHVSIEFNFTDISFNSDGIDLVELYVSTNNHNEFQEIGKIASGGELSRILLAIKASSTSKNSATIFFDEIDSGVSGIVAHLMAKTLMELAKNTQIIFISHLPQMITVADNFLHVSKVVDKNSALSTISSLHGEELVDKLAYFIQNQDESTESKNVIRQMLNEVKG